MSHQPHLCSWVRTAISREQRTAAANCESELQPSPRCTCTCTESTHPWLCSNHLSNAVLWVPSVTPRSVCWLRSRETRRNGEYNQRWRASPLLHCIAAPSPEQCSAPFRRQQTTFRPPYASARRQMHQPHPPSEKISSSAAAFDIASSAFAFRRFCTLSTSEDISSEDIHFRQPGPLFTKTRHQPDMLPHCCLTMRLVCALPRSSFCI